MNFVLILTLSGQLAFAETLKFDTLGDCKLAASIAVGLAPDGPAKASCKRAETGEELAVYERVKQRRKGCH